MGSEDNGVNPFYGSGWDPMVTLNQSATFGNSSMVPQTEFGNAQFLENQMMGHSSQLVHHFQSDPSLIGMLPKMPSYGSGSFSEMVSSFGHIAESGSHPSFNQNNVVGIQTVSNSKERCQNSGDGVVGASPSRNRKRKVSVGASSKVTH